MLSGWTYGISYREIADFIGTAAGIATLIGLPVAIAGAWYARLAISDASKRQNRKTLLGPDDFTDASITLEIRSILQHRIRNGRYRKNINNLLSRFGINRLLNIAADKSADAAFVLALSYWEGLGVAQSDEKFMFFLEESAALGNHDAGAFLLVRKLIPSIGFEKSEAAQLFLKSEQSKLNLANLTALAQRGNVTAQFELGKAYRSGWFGLSKDTTLAITWFQKARDQGSEEARFWVGMLILPELLQAEILPATDRFLRRQLDYSMYSEGELEIRRAAENMVIDAQLALAVWKFRGSHNEKKNLRLAKQMFRAIAADQDASSLQVQTANKWLRHKPQDN